MSRRVSQTFQTRENFLNQNQELIEFQSHIIPGQDDGGRFRPEVQTDNQDPELMNFPDPIVVPPIWTPWGTIPGFDIPQHVAIPEIGTVGADFGSDHFEIDATVIRTTRSGREVERDGFVSVTGEGFGVASGGDFKEIGELFDEEDGPSLGDAVEDTLNSLSSVGERESLDVEVKGDFQSPFEDPGEIVSLDEQLSPELEGRDLSFSFEVVGGTGEIVVTFSKDRGPWEAPEETVQTFDPFSSGGLRYRSPDPGNTFNPVRPEDGFDDFSISTTGDLEIIVTEMHVTTGMGDDPFDII